MSIPRSLLDDVAGYADSWLAFRAQALGAPGVQAAILSDGDVVLSTAHGLADLERNVPLRTDHLFRVASVSKTFTATAIMQLCRLRRLRLDDLLSTHIEWLGEAPMASIGELTVRDLLSHSGGLVRDGIDGDYWQFLCRFPDEGGLQTLLREGAAALPVDQEFKYSNMGYALLGLVVARASAGSWSGYVRREIIERLGLRDTGPDYEPGRSGGFAPLYSGTRGGFERCRIDNGDTRAMAPATGMFSTAEDLCRYAAAHFFGDERLLADASKRRMQREAWGISEEREGLGYGMGFDLHDVGKRRIVGHGGSYPGHRCRLWFDPHEGFAVAVLANAIDVPAADLATGVVRLIDFAAGLDQQAEQPDADLDRFCGRFYNIWGVTDIVRFGRRLFAIDPSDDDPIAGITHLRVASDSRLQITRCNGFGSAGEHLAYSFRDDGSVEQIRGGSSMFPRDEYVTRVLAGPTIAPPGGPHIGG